MKDSVCSLGQLKGLIFDLILLKCQAKCHAVCVRWQTDPFFLIFHNSCSCSGLLTHRIIYKFYKLRITIYKRIARRISRKVVRYWYTVVFVGHNKSEKRKSKSNIFLQLGSTSSKFCLAGCTSISFGTLSWRKLHSGPGRVRLGFFS